MNHTHIKIREFREIQLEEGIYWKAGMAFSTNRICVIPLQHRMALKFKHMTKHSVKRMCALVLMLLSM